jgi:hypothetical protein
LPAIIGAILVLAGIAQVFVQMSRHRDRTKFSDQDHLQSGNFGRDGLKVQSRYPGMVMTCVGALLLLASYFFGR